MGELYHYLLSLKSPWPEKKVQIKNQTSINSSLANVGEEKPRMLNEPYFFQISKHHHLKRCEI